MKALAQRVARSSVTVGDEVVGKTGRGLLVLFGVRHEDEEEDARHLAHRTVNLRVFADEAGKMNLSVEDIGGEILVVPQFTLYADTRKGNRPSFVRAAQPEKAEHLFLSYVAALRRALGDDAVGTGLFGANMLVEIANDGPVTVELNTDKDLETRPADPGR